MFNAAIVVEMGRVERNSGLGRMTGWLVLLLLFLSAAGQAQVLYGSLTGNVTDSSGAALSGAKVEVLNIQTGVLNTLTTDDHGVYRISELRPGIYKVTISAANFTTAITENLRVDANTGKRMDMTLSVATRQEIVQVSSEMSLLQADKADVHTNLQAAQIENLPITGSEGRNFQSLYKLVPGFGNPVEFNSSAGNPQRSMSANVNGQSVQGNNTRIDGVQNSYPYLPANVAYVPPADAIETVNISTNSYDAEQGTAGGAAVNVQIKSGTNEFHGSGHEFHTDNALRALNFFNPATFRKPKNILNQFGGTLGGPILKDKLFFFGDWETTHQRLSATRTLTLPTDALRNGDFSGVATTIYDPNTGSPNGVGRTPFAGNKIPSNRIDPAAAALTKLLPATNLPGSVNNYFASGTAQFNRDNFDVKINYAPSQKSGIFGRYSLSRSFIFDPPALGAAGGDATNFGSQGNAFGRVQSVGIGGNYLLTTHMLVDANVGYTRQRLNAEDTDISSNFGRDVLKIPGTNGQDRLQGGIPAFQISNYANLGNASTGNPFLFRDNQYVSNANMTWLRGQHNFRFGLEYDRTGINHFQAQGGAFQTARGSFRFTGIATALNGGGAPDLNNSWAQFLLGLPNEVGQAVQNVNPIALRWSQWAGYARDQWQILPRLTVTYGMRWELYPFATSDHGGARILDPATMNVLIGGNGNVPLNDGVDVGRGQFLPRLGVAYRATDTTVIRAGFGISSDPYSFHFLRNAFPAVTVSDFSGLSGNTFAPAASLTGTTLAPYPGLPAGITPIPLPNISSGIVPLPDGAGTVTVPLKFKRGYIMSWNLTVQHEFAGFVGEAGYVATRGVNPLAAFNINASPLGGGQNGRALNAQFGHTAANGFKGWGDINYESGFQRNYYDSLQTKLTRQIGAGSQIGILYTWSKAIDYSDNEDLAAVAFPFPAYWQKNKALASFDRTNNFQAYGSYSLPFGREQRWAQRGLLNHLVGGWQLNWVLSRTSGTPFTITADGASAQAAGSQQTADVVGPIRILGGTPRANCAATDLTCHYFSPAAFAQPTGARFGTGGRDNVRGPGLFNLDTSLFRNFKLTERFTLQFRGEAFGVTNTPHFANPGANVAGTNFGIITSSTGERQIWLAAKVLF